jgi:hypothetical protein
MRRRLCILGTVSLAIYAVLVPISFAFRNDGDHPILGVVALLAIATLAYFLAVASVFGNQTALGADGQPSSRRLLYIIVGFAVAFRVLLLPSWPIQEIDYYRYLWDGRVTLAGMNPYHYSPSQIDDAILPSVSTAPELGILDQLSQSSATVDAIFKHVHYRDVPTAYPPVAQVVFAAAALLTPAAAPLWAHLLVLKAILLAFDLATLGVVILLLRRLQLPETWSLTYGWCPLALKEFANSGHFDSVAVFFTALALLALVSLARQVAGEGRLRVVVLATCALAALALGVLAKSYPIVLLPVVIAYLTALLRWRVVVPLSGFVAVVVIGYLPFVDLANASDKPLAGSAADSPQTNHPGTGLGTFLSQWQMNDFLFMLVHENLRPAHGQPDHWFVLVPAESRDALQQQVLVPWAAAFALPVKSDPALVLTQMLMALILMGLILRWAWKVYRQPEPEALLRAVLLTLAWSWLLSAAQNPWYLLWCLPFMVFAGRRSWFLLPGLVLLYYVRFWIEAHDTSGTTDVFDFGWVWLEYVPFFLALALESWMSRRTGCANPMVVMCPVSADVPEGHLTIAQPFMAGKRSLRGASSPGGTAE